MFNKSLQTIELSRLNGWFFRTGNDTDCAKPQFGKGGWKKLNPNQLTVANADKNGRLEGWFQLNFLLDSSFVAMPTGIRCNRWAATDIYVDGHYIVSFGNTGYNGKAFKENTNLYTGSHQLSLSIGKTHTLAVHLVDYACPFNPRFLKTASLYSNFDSFIQLTGPSALNKTIAYLQDLICYLYLYTGLIGAFGLLFWFLYWQNSREKNLFYVSISTTFFFIWVWFIALSVTQVNLDFNQWWLLFFIAVQSWPVAIALMVYTVGEIFNFRHKKALIIFGVLFVVTSIIGTYFPEAAAGMFYTHPLMAVVLLFYIMLTSWKKLRGAQWAVVAGIISTAIFSFASSYFRGYYHDVLPFHHFYDSGSYLSFPMSLMVYVSIRFKEILTEVQANAKKVVFLSEEKKEQAINQQKVLEAEVARQTVELRSSLESLKAAQAQLIQAEKMASLGELTAGIAHEIQNPLNFVNNFSEVSRELIAEMRDEMEAGNNNNALAIVNDVEQNLEKINHHGKRADAIVKGMLQHSRKSAGQKDQTNLNNLTDEYLRLAYQGFRAKDKSFSAELVTHFDVNLPLINVIPQDIGRVCLNLFNNAFYAVQQKQKTVNADNHPEVAVTTYAKNGHVVIEVKDNGTGIPDAIKDKIMQPFFTTKPTGQGTGLGLSLSYDIVKAHGGEIKVESTEGEGTTFLILLPMRL